MTLLRKLSETGQLDLLTDNEIEMLQSEDAEHLTATEQWHWISNNRRLGSRVTLLGAGVRILLLMGGSIAALGFALDPLHQIASNVGRVAMTIAAIAGLVWTFRHAKRLRARLDEMKRILPSLEELNIVDPTGGETERRIDR